MVKESTRTGGGETPIYADDLNPRIANNNFFGEGFEEAVAQAEAQNDQVIVGYFIPEFFIEGKEERLGQDDIESVEEEFTRKDVEPGGSPNPEVNR